LSALQPDHASRPQDATVPRTLRLFKPTDRWCAAVLIVWTLATAASFSQTLGSSADP
jgi:hypothetical protein